MGRAKLAERFAAKYVVDEETECWEWTGCKTRGGYGHIQVDGTPRRAHRVSWELNRGPIPEGLHVLHRCDNPGCVNPEHLFLGTNQDNVDDMVAKGRQLKGESNGRAVLNEPQVRAIIELCRRHPERGNGQSGRGLLLFLARYLEVPHDAVKAVARGRRWLHLQQQEN